MDGGQSPVRPVGIRLRRMLRISYIPKLEHPGGLAAWFQLPGRTKLEFLTSRSWNIREGLWPGSSFRVAQNGKAPQFRKKSAKSGIHGFLLFRMW